MNQEAAFHPAKGRERHDKRPSFGSQKTAFHFIADYQLVTDVPQPCCHCGKDNANERKESLLSVSRARIILPKASSV